MANNVHLNEDQRRKFNQQMAELKKSGFFPTIKRTAKTRAGIATKYLIVSYGGTGAGALLELKKTLAENVDSSQEDYVRLLAIDSDRNEQFISKNVKGSDGDEKLGKEKKFSDEEFFHLSGSRAKDIVLNHPEKVKDWYNPKLIPAVEDDDTLLNGDGASGTRQFSRLMLMSTVTLSAIQSRIRALAEELVGGTASDLNVIIISGISGGTGSGVVIDLSYIIRNTLESYVGGRLQYYGFLLLPTTGNSSKIDDIKKGNQNGYAALKEVNYFMTLAKRRETYVFHTEGMSDIVSGKNIFDVCYLIDGGQSLTTIGSNARKAAFSVLSEFLLDMITLQAATGDNGEAPQTAESILSDVRANRMQMIRSRNAHEAPRDADYSYCIMGHAETVIPINLIKSYVANKIFSKMYESFKNCENVNQRAVAAFYKAVLIPTSSADAQRREINSEAEKIFKDPYRGPFYIINLMRDVSEYAKEEAGKFHFDKNKQNQKNFISKYCNELNNNTFAIFTAVMDSMKEIMNQNGEMLLASSKTGDFGGYNYSFMPIDLSVSNERSRAVNKYLEKLVNDSTVESMAEEILAELIQDRDAWSERINSEKTTTTNSASEALRKFWLDKIDKLVTATLEDFLIKYYSGDENATYRENDPETEHCLTEAAEIICNEMLGAGGKAHPMAQVTSSGSLTLSTAFDGRYSILIPEKVSHLRAAVRAYVGTLPNRAQIKVYSSAASDRVTCYSQHVSIPAFKFKWVCDAEAEYENALTVGKEGLHMSESISGRQWKDFPNLLLESTWRHVPTDGTPYTNAREAGINRKAHELFDSARALGLTSSMGDPNIQGIITYTLKLLPESMRPAERLYKELELFKKTDVEYKNKQAEIDNAANTVAEDLFRRLDSLPENVVDTLETKVEEDKRVEFQLKELSMNETVQTYGGDAPENWNEEFASLLLRKMPEAMIALRGTIDVIRRVIDMVNTAKNQINMLADFAKILSIKAVAYNEKLYAWEYDNRGMSDTLVELEPFSEVDKMAEYYIMFEALKRNAPAHEALMERYQEEMEKQNDGGREAVITMTKERKDNAAEFKAIIDARCAKPDNSRPMETLGTAAFKAAAERKGYNPRELFDFYRKLSAELGAI